MSESSNPQPALGAAVKASRIEKKATQEALAQGAGITVAHLSKIERGLTNPTWGTVTGLADALGLRIADLAKRVEKFQ